MQTILGSPVIYRAVSINRRRAVGMMPSVKNNALTFHHLWVEPVLYAPEIIFITIT